MNALCTKGGQGARNVYSNGKHDVISIKTLFNSCERLLSGTFISGQLNWNTEPQIGTNCLTLSTT